MEEVRIGFVGEVGWELHFPSEYGEHVWDSLMDAGEEFGILPFGLEAQRILRLEKKHIIVGQDTDAVSNPLDSDMGWVVRFDKDDFIGRGGLLAARERGPRNLLVGFIMRDGRVPEDGDPVVVDGAPVGRVTAGKKWLADIPLPVLADRSGQLQVVTFPCKLTYLGRKLVSGYVCNAIQLDGKAPKRVPERFDPMNRTGGKIRGALFYDIETGLLAEAHLDIDIHFSKDNGRLEDRIRAQGRLDITRR